MPIPPGHTVWRGLAAALLMLACTVPVLAQPGPTVVWEQMPLFTNSVPSQRAYAVGWLVGDGTADPALDTLVMFHGYGVFRYAPGEANGEWGAWRLLNNNSPSDGLVTSEGSIVFVQGMFRSTDGGLTWTSPFQGVESIQEITLPWMREASSGRAVLIVASEQVNRHTISYADGETGSWRDTGVAGAFTETTGEVPPSPALPLGRLLSSSEQIMYSDDGSETWQTAAFGGQPQQSYLRFEFAFLPRSDHPYGGIAFALGCGEYTECDGGAETAVLYRSDDGGASWTFVHHFTAAETGLPFINGTAVKRGVPFAGPDGALWAALTRSGSGPNPGRIMRSTDEGVTWQHADAGLAQANNGGGWRVYQFKLARDGRLYAATDRGVWRTTQPIATAAQANPPRPVVPGLTVSPNPSSGEVTLSVSATEPAATLVVTVFDVAGRVVEHVYTGPVAVGEHRYTLDTRTWASGVYVAQVWVRGQAHTVRFTVAR